MFKHRQVVLELVRLLGPTSLIPTGVWIFIRFSEIAL